MMGEEILDIKNVYECNRYLGCKTLHPQASVVNLGNPTVSIQSFVRFDFYAILLAEECADENNSCGRKYYDYSYATMIFLTPGEIFRMNEAKALPNKGWLLTFHPDLLFRTTLKKHLKDYTFFSYWKEEALHLSQRETRTAICCFENIIEELNRAIDVHTGTILSRHIELLLDYCSRFYERQFITRENRNKMLLEKLDRMLVDYIRSGQLQNGHLPEPTYYADQLKLSTAYFNDLVKFGTGKTFVENFEFKRLDIAKKMLLDMNNTPTLVARQLGFSNVQRFCFLFKKLIGIPPTEYKFSQN